MYYDYLAYDSVVYYDDDYKSLLLSDAVIDQGIRELVDAINECEYLVTMNSCQGFLVANERAKHCPCTYVNFFVLEHFYEVAEKLFILLVEKFGSRIVCSMEYQADFDIYDEPDGETAKDNGYVIPRYHIEFYELIDDLHLSTYREVVEVIKLYVADINRRFN